MQYDAITIDTNIFRQNGWNLESGLLGQLTQFKEGSAQFVLSEIVIREIHKYLKIEAKEAQDALEASVKKVDRNKLLPIEILSQIQTISGDLATPEEAAKQRLKAFSDCTGMTIIPAELADIKDLVRRYFKPGAPFEGSGKKKNEFPDAIALLSLEAWAKSEGKKILAISDDGGWADFCKDSEWIDIEKDLAASLQKLQLHTEQARSLVTLLLGDMDAGRRPDLLEQIAEAIAEAVGEMDVYAEASSAFHYDADSVAMSIQDFQFLDPEDGYRFDIVQIGKDRLTTKIGISIVAKAECDFSFAVWDSIDKDYVPMGNGSAETEVEFEAAILVSIEGDFSKSPPEVGMSSLELINGIDSVDFDEVEPNFGDDHYDEPCEEEA